MKINVTKTDKLNEIMDEVQDRCKERLLHAEGLQNYLEIAERKLKHLLPKSHWVGIRLVIDDHAQNFPHAYKGAPMSTQATVVRYPAGWYVTRVTRTYCKAQGHEIDIAFPDGSAEKMLQFVSKQFYRWGLT